MKPISDTKAIRLMTFSDTVKSLVGKKRHDSPDWTQKLEELVADIPATTLCKLEMHFDALRISKEYDKKLP